MIEKVAIIGAGISGLSFGYQLIKNNHHNFTIYESASRCGGVISTHSDSKYLYEEGPNTFSISDKRTLKMINDLNLEIVYPLDSSKARYILRNNEPKNIPNSFFPFLTSDFISLTTKLKILKEVFNRKKPLNETESIYDFFERRFNKEFVEYLVNPFIAGTFSGNPKTLSIKHAFPKIYDLENKYKSITKGFIKSKKSPNQIKRSIISFKSGMEELIISLSKLLEKQICLNSKVISIDNVDSKFVLKVSINNETITRVYDKVVVTIPTHKLNELKLTDQDPINLKNNINIDYPPLSTITLSYKKKDIPLPINGFGLLVPEIEKKNILGVLYLSSMFDNRAPKDETLLTVFIGGSRQPSLASLSKKEIIKLVKTDLKSIYGIINQPVYVEHKFWPQSIPQYSLDYQNHLNSLKKIEKNLNGLIFTGNYIGGISLENNILNAMKSANKLINYNYE